jgi:hypothetical protein
MICKERKLVTYDLERLEIIANDNTILSCQIKGKILKKKNIIWPNQKKCGESINNGFNDRKIVHILCYGKTQTGKTGCMTSLIQHFLLSNNIPIDHIYIITGLSDIAWKKDTKDRMPESISGRVFHRANLPKTFVKDIQSKKNLLIIMDEIQMACKTEQTISKTFRECGFYDLDNLLENDIKIVQFSATPDGHIEDLSNWKDHSIKIKLEPGVGYVGTKELNVSGRLRQFKDLTQIENVQALKEVVNGYSTPRYHTIRIPNSRNDMDKVVMSHFKKVFGSTCKYNKKYLKIKKNDINDILEEEPNVHTFIFIKEILRCAKTKKKDYLGIEYERWTTMSDSSIIQGSVGRLTGYDDNGDSICYTNIDTIERYERLWDNDFEFTEGLEWNTSTTKFDRDENRTLSTGQTYNSVENINGLEGDTSTINEQQKKLIIIKKKTHNEIKEFYKNKLKPIWGGIGPKKRNTNTDGFIECTIKGTEKVWSLDEIKKSSTYKGAANNKYWYYPCYKDITDTSTLRFCLIYYDPN